MRAAEEDHRIGVLTLHTQPEMPAAVGRADRVADPNPLTSSHADRREVGVGDDVAAGANADELPVGDGTGESDEPVGQCVDLRAGRSLELDAAMARAVAMRRGFEAAHDRARQFDRARRRRDENNRNDEKHEKSSH